MTEIQNIPYFDGHCDTIWRCMKREAVPDYGATEDECRAYFSACAALRIKQHIALSEQLFCAVHIDDRPGVDARRNRKCDT